AVNGRVMEVQAMRRAYFPLSAGRFAFAPARAVIDVREGFLFAPESREIRSSSPRLTALPLPETGQPPGFKGAVGNYQIRAFLQPDTIAVGEAAQITIELAGTGNIKAAPPPILPAIPGVEQFTPTEEATVAFSDAIVRGTKRFQWVVIPNDAGTIEIPSAIYAFFNPGTREYRTIKTAPLTLVATSAAAAADAAAAAASLRALRAKPQHASLAWVRTRGFLLAQSIPLLVIVITLSLLYMHRRQSTASSLLKDFKRIRDANSAYPDFLRQLEAVLRSALRRTGGDTDVRARLLTLIGRIEAQRFAPAAAEATERASLLSEAEELIRLVASNDTGSTAVKHRSHEPQSRTAVLLVIALAQPQSVAPFERGIELYRSGQFTHAARAFSDVVARDSTDVSAWMNLGNSHYRAGERGRAIWAWARAARQSPRDDAISRNLQSVGAVEVLRTRPPLSVRPVEWYLLAALAWWGACAIALTAIVRRRLPLFSWALAPIASAVVALFVGVIADGRTYAVALNEDTRLYGDPTVHSPVVRRVQAGAGLDVLEERDGWLRVRTVTQAEGWVEADDAGRL
ncbi:MAG: BatD family protein, partial [Gemmatimonadota bacterium]